MPPLYFEDVEVDRGVMLQRVEVSNQDGEVVAAGEFVMLLRRRADR